MSSWVKPHVTAPALDRAVHQLGATVLCVRPPFFGGVSGGFGTATAGRAPSPT